MHLREFLTEDAIELHLKSATADDVMVELVNILHLDEKSTATLVKLVHRREELGSTGVGRGIAIPHGRSTVVNKLRLAYGRHQGGIPYRAIDDRPVHHFFLIVAPPVEVSNQYLPVLGKIAQLAKEPDVPERLTGVTTPEEFFQLLEEKGV